MRRKSRQHRCILWTPGVGVAGEKKRKKSSELVDSQVEFVVPTSERTPLPFYYSSFESHVKLGQKGKLCY